MKKHDSAPHDSKKLRPTNHRPRRLRWGLWPWLLLAACPAATLLAAPADNSTHDGEEQRWFQIEMILFAQKQGSPLDSEQWPDIADIRLPPELRELTLPTPEPVAEAEPETAAAQAAAAAPIPSNPEATTTEPEPALAMPVAFQMLPEEGLQLNELLAKLRRSRGYHPLLHIAWNQPTLGRDQARPVLLFQGMSEPLPEAGTDPAAAPGDEASGESAPTATPEPPSFSLQPVPATEADADIGPPNPRFVGTVRVSVERYLHVDADLLYRIPVTQQQPVPVPDLDLWYDRPYPTLSEPQGPAFQLQEWQAMRGFRLEESRRMRSGKIHYLDNPFLGLVVLITPVELPPPPAEVTLDPMNLLTAPAEP
jgi:hypothetical protein